MRTVHSISTAYPQAKNGAEADWFFRDGHLICRTKQDDRSPALPPYQPPKWKTAPDHSWMEELLADVQEFEKRMAAPEGQRKKDVCIR